MTDPTRQAATAGRTPSKRYAGWRLWLGFGALALLAVWYLLPSPESSLESGEPELSSAAGAPARLSDAALPLTAMRLPDPAPLAETRADELAAPPARSGFAALHVLVQHASSGTPLADIGVSVVPWGLPDAVNHSVTRRSDEAGRAEFAELPPGRMHVELDRGGTLETHVAAGETGEVVLTLSDGMSVTGLVVDMQGRPVPGATIWLSRYFSVRWGGIAAVADAEGRFSLAHVGRHRYITAWSERETLSTMIFLDGSDPAPELVLRLDSQAGSVEGRVVTERGDPVPAASIRIGAATGWPSRIDGTGAVLAGAPPRTVTSNDDGAFFLQGLPPGETVLVMRHPDSMAVALPVVVRAGEVVTLDVMAQSGGTVKGRVLDTFGGPVDGAVVSFGHKLALDESSAVTDATGAFLLPHLPPGLLRLVATAPEQGRAEGEVLVESGRVIEWEAQLATERVLEGRVLTDSGLALVGARVEIHPVGVTHPWWMTVSTEGGRFRLHDVPPLAQVTCEVFPDSATPLPLFVSVLSLGQPAGELLLVTPDPDRPAALLRGRVVDDADRPVSTLVNLCRTGTSHCISVQTDLYGGFEFTAPAPGDYIVTTRGDALSSTEHPVHLEPGQLTDAGLLRIVPTDSPEVTAPAADDASR